MPLSPQTGPGSLPGRRDLVILPFYLRFAVGFSRAVTTRQAGPGRQLPRGPFAPLSPPQRGEGAGNGALRPQPAGGRAGGSGGGSSLPATTSGAVLPQGKSRPTKPPRLGTCPLRLRGAEEGGAGRAELAAARPWGG